jgi:Peptidase A4 family
MHPRMMLPAALVASTVAAFGLGGLRAAPSAWHGGGGIEILAPRPPGAHPAAAAPGVAQSYSLHWSGYEQVGTKTKVFTAVMGTWIVPTVVTGPGDQSSSDWVGIDGARNTTTLIQDGTESNNVAGTPQYQAWTEVVGADSHQKVVPLTIKPGDEMEGEVREIGTNKWSLTVSDLTTGKSYTRPPVSFTTPGKDVEAIHERPCIKGDCKSASDFATLAITTNITQLPDYYSTAPPGETPAWTVLGKTVPGATLHQLFMVNNKGTKVIASPSALNSAKDGFTVADRNKSPAPPSSWFATKTLLPPNAAATPYNHQGLGLPSVACASASSCVAVGSYSQKPDAELSDGLLLAGSGASWTPREAPLPANADNNVSDGVSLAAVTCPSVAGCVAVGTYPDTSLNEQMMVLTGSGSSWTATEVPSPAGLFVEHMSSVACPSASVCVAVGSAGDQGLVLSRSGPSWTAAQAPLPANAFGDGFLGLTSVACSSTTSCTAVGSYYDNSGNSQGMLLTWSGSSWTAAQAPLPPGTENSDLESVACSPATGCAAVGYYTDAVGNQQGLLLTGSGSSWHATSVPLPSNADANPNPALESVSCSQTSGCVAFGYYETSGTGQGLLLTGSGSSWTATEAPVPTNGLFWLNNPLLVACTAAPECAAIGSYSDASNNIAGLLLTGYGTSWAPAKLPLPQGASSGAPVLSSVACAPTSNCLVSGLYFDSSDHAQSFLAWGPS